MINAKRTISLILTLAMLLCLAPAMAFNIASADTIASNVDSRISDPSTMDGWKELFKEDSTLNAGAVWADKSVFTDTSLFPDEVKLNDPQNNLLVALSAIASNKEIVGYSTIPTDTILVLDISGSMSNSGWDDDLAVAANAAIKKLLETNLNNRVGVILYSGSSSFGTSTYNQSVKVLFELDRYTTQNDKFLDFANHTISVNTNVRTEGGKNPADTSANVTGGTYIQAGINEAVNQFLKQETVITEGFQDGKKRMPIMVLMSDGDPTIATTNYDDVDKASSNIGNGGDTSDSLAFITQLTASYALNKIEQHYDCDGEALFYTLSLGGSVSDIGRSILNPAQNTNAINNYWDSYFKLGNNQALTLTVPGTRSSSNNNTKSVSIYRNSDVTVKNYVDKYFPAQNEKDFLTVFDTIIDEIILQSRYYPTHLQGGNPDFSGYLTFEDTLGEHTEIKEVLGILMGDTLYSGKRLSDAVSIDGMGTIENPTDFGLEFRDSVKTRLGITENAEVFDLIANAYNSKQLIYSEDDPHCYIGWYAGAGGKYLGFWNEGETTAPADALYKVKSYGFLGENVGNLKESDMMFMTLRVITNIENGKQTVLWKIPAALVPLITYSITLKGDKIEGATDVELECTPNTPVRLLMEVGLMDNVNRYNLHGITDAHHMADDGVTRKFYTNHFDISAPDHESHITAGVTFTPSVENELYYFTENSIIYEYKNNQYVAVTDDNYNFNPNATYYHADYIFTADSDVPLYNYSKIYADAFSQRVYDTDKGAWIIPIGTPIVNRETYEVPKTENITKSAGFSLYPYVQKTNASYDAYFNLGNNGLITLTPVQGIKISKTLDAAEPGANDNFEFKVMLTPPEGVGLDASYPVMTDVLDGTHGEINNVAVTNGVMTINLKAGQSAYITDLPNGTKYVVTESLHSDYVLKSIHKNGIDMTASGAEGVVAEYTLDDIDFVNTIAAEGSLIISKTVTHPFGNSYTVPANVKFTAEVSLVNPTIIMANQSYELILPDGTTSSVTTDAHGKFTVTLSHGESVVIHGLPEGTTTYTVTEINIPDGFTLDAVNSTGLTGIIQSASAQRASLVNSYTPDPVAIEAEISVEKLLSGRDWLDGESYSFNLYRYDPFAGETNTLVGNITVDAATQNKTASIILNESYARAGSYQYLISEAVGTAGGVTYDTADRRFRINVADTDMDGKLEIISAENIQNTTITKNGNRYTVSASFNNLYAPAQGESVKLDVIKTMTGNFGLNGFSFALYEQGSEDALLVSNLTDINGNASFYLYFPAEMAGNTYSYVLKEVATSISGMEENTQSYTLDFVVTDNLDGTTSVTVYIDGEPLTDQNKPTFNNVYDPVDAQILFSGEKKLEGRVENANEFSFNLYRTDSSFAIDGVTPLQTVYNDVMGGFIFDPVVFDTAGEYYFVITETEGDLAGITYDNTQHRITVTVSDNGGTLVASSDLNYNIEFNNTYIPAPVDVTINGSKILSGRDIADGEFQFVLKQEGVEIEKVNNLGSAFSFETITYRTAGVYTYTVEETDNGLAGVTYDTAIYEITVTVTDNGNGKLLATVDMKKNGLESTEIVFVNEYIPAPYSFTLNGTKNLTGREQNANEFKFSLVNLLTDQVAETVANGADGSFSFSEITVRAAGHYHYHVIEVGEELPGITYDTAIQHIDIEVTDVGGRLEGRIIINDADNGEITFNNVYDALDASVTLKGIKEFTNGNLTQGLFSFNLIENGDVVQTVTNGKDGAFEFEPIIFNQEGVYEYLIAEVNDNKDGVIYDDAERNVTVTVTDIGGILAAKVEIDGEITDTATVTNVYDPVDTEITITGKKFYNRQLAGGEFQFVLKQGDEIVQTVSNDINGDFKFVIPFDKAGEYEYTVSEVNGGNKHIVYDSAVRNVKITVTDIDGRLVAKCQINGMDISIVNFTNSFMPNPDNVEKQVKIKKTVTNLGQEQITPEGFRFVFANQDTGAKQLITVDKNGEAEMDFTFTKAQIGSELSFTVYEFNDNREGVTYDTRAYNLTFTVELDENNELSVKCFIDGKEVTDPVLTFENSYEPQIPQPGDETNMLLFVLMLLFSMAVLAKAVPAMWNKYNRV